MESNWNANDNTNVPPYPGTGGARDTEQRYDNSDGRDIMHGKPQYNEGFDQHQQYSGAGTGQQNQYDPQQDQYQREQEFSQDARHLEGQHQDRTGPDTGIGPASGAGVATAYGPAGNDGGRGHLGRHHGGVPHTTHGVYEPRETAIVDGPPTHPTLAKPVHDEHRGFNDGHDGTGAGMGPGAHEARYGDAVHDRPNQHAAGASVGGEAYGAGPGPNAGAYGGPAGTGGVHQGHPGAAGAASGHPPPPQNPSGTSDKIMGKLQQAAGLLVSSDRMMAKGLERESRGVAADNITEAQRLEAEAAARRERAVGYGAHPSHKQPGGQHHA